MYMYILARFSLKSLQDSLSLKIVHTINLFHNLTLA